MKSVLSNVTKADVCTDPFPHIVIHNPIDEDLYAQMAARYPHQDLLIYDNHRYPGNDPGNNKRFGLMTIDINNNPLLDPIWREFTRVHCNRDFFLQVMDLFADHIRQIHPGIEDLLGPLNDPRVGMRYFDTFDDHEILVDATIVINSPVHTEGTRVRVPHVDRVQKLYSGLLYLRHPEDQSTGGDLVLYRFKNGTPEGFLGRDVDDRHVEAVKVIPYQSNVLVMFPHHIKALHGVTPRSLAPMPRRLLTFSCDTPHELYNVDPFQLETATV